MKDCRKCGVTRPLTCFQVDRLCRDGRRRTCNICRPHSKGRRSPIERTDETRAKGRRYAQAFRERMSPDERAASIKRSREYRLNNDDARQRDAARKRNKRRESPDEVRAAGRISRELRRGLEASAEGTFTQANIDLIYKQQKRKCAYCKLRLPKSYCIDHKMPLFSGGSNWPRNLQLTCKPCNSKKGAKDPINFAQTIGLLI